MFSVKTAKELVNEITSAFHDIDTREQLVVTILMVRNIDRISLSIFFKCFSLDLLLTSLVRIWVHYFFLSTNQSLFFIFRRFSQINGLIDYHVFIAH